MLCKLLKCHLLAKSCWRNGHSFNLDKKPRDSYTFRALAMTLVKRCFADQSSKYRENYVSKHFEVGFMNANEGIWKLIFLSCQVPPGHLEEHLERKQISFEAGPEYYTLHSCPQYICKMKDSTGASSGHFNVVKINRISGRYHCSMCGSAGSWFDFKAALEGQVLSITPVRQIFRRTADDPVDGGTLPTAAQDQRLERYAGSLPMSKDVLAWLIDKRKISMETLLAYKAFRPVDHHFVTRIHLPVKPPPARAHAIFLVPSEASQPPGPCPPGRARTFHRRHALAAAEHVRTQAHFLAPHPFATLSIPHRRRHHHHRRRWVRGARKEVPARGAPCLPTPRQRTRRCRARVRRGRWGRGPSSSRAGARTPASPSPGSTTSPRTGPSASRRATRHHQRGRWRGERERRER